MKAFVLGDLQLNTWPNFGDVPTETTQISARLMDVIHELQRIRKLAIERQVTHVFILGDIFEDRGTLEVVVLNSLYREMFKYRKVGIKVLLLVGNHDRAPVGNFHSLEVLQDLCTVVDKPMTYDFSGTKVLAIPYMSESKNVEEELQTHGKKADIILMHVGIKDTPMSTGAKWADGIKLKRIPKKPMVFLGHDHQHKRLRKNVWCVGSLLHVNRGDTDQKKVFAEYNNGKVKWYETEGPDFVTVHVSERWKNEISQANIRFHNTITGNFVTIDYSGKQEDIGKVKNRILKLGARGVEVVPTLQQTEGLSSGSIRLSALDRLDHALQKVVNKASVLDRKEILELGRQILTEAFDEYQTKRT